MHIELNSWDHRKGDSRARITLIEFGDFQCSYCAAAFPIVESTMAEAGHGVRLVFRNFPLLEAHPFAMKAAMTAEAAALQGKFWQMHRLLFENQQLFQTKKPESFAEQLGLSLDRFVEDFHSKDVKEKIENDIRVGLRLGVQGTPTFFINGQFFTGDWTQGALLKKLRQLSAAAGFQKGV